MKILIAGDFCPQYRVAKLFDDDVFESVLGDVKRRLLTVDYSIVNFECPVICGKEAPIVKSGENLSCSEKGLKAVKWVGFDCVTLANNHFLDFGEEGATNTLSLCHKMGIDTVGGGANLQDASLTLYKIIGGKTIAIINCCEREYSIAKETAAGSNPLNAIKQYYAIQDARKTADFVLVIIHGGHELWQLPSPRMKEIYRFFIDAGADAVVNHHQHCYSGYEVYKGKPIFYGLGNFCFDSKNREKNIWYQGYMVILHFLSSVDFEIVPYVQCLNTPTIHLLSQNESDSFNETIRKLNETIEDDALLKQSFNIFLNSKNLTHVITPYNNKYLLYLFHKGLLPSFYPRKKYLLLREMFTCDSHTDAFLYFIDKQLENL